MTTQLSAIEQALNSYCEVASASDAEVAKICEYAHTGVLTAEAAANAIFNILRTRAARNLQTKAAVHVRNDIVPQLPDITRDFPLPAEAYVSAQ